MKIFYVATYDISDIKEAANGIDHFKLKALVSAGCDVSRLHRFLLLLVAL